jgi:hypothetical protein
VTPPTPLEAAAGGSIDSLKPIISRGLANGNIDPGILRGCHVNQWLFVVTAWRSRQFGLL